MRRNNRPTGVTKWSPGNLPAWYARLPKAALFVLAQSLAAQVTGHCEYVLESGEADEVLFHEWESQYRAGNIPQCPPKST